MVSEEDKKDIEDCLQVLSTGNLPNTTSKLRRVLQMNKII